MSDEDIDTTTKTIQNANPPLLHSGNYMHALYSSPKKQSDVLPASFQSHSNREFPPAFPVVDHSPLAPEAARSSTSQPSHTST